MLANFLNDGRLRRDFSVSLSYRASHAYTAGLRQRTRLDFAVYPLRFPEPSHAIPMPRWCPLAVRRAVRVGSRLLTTYPLLAYEVWRLRRLFVRIAPDIVHINNGGYPAALSARAAAIAARMADVPATVMVVNNLAEPAGGPAAGARRVLDGIVVRGVSQFVTGSQAAASQLRRVLRLPDDRVIARANGIALRPQTETREETLARLQIDDAAGVLFGVIGVLEPRKGHRVLLEAIAALGREQRAVPPFTVLVEGAGGMLDDLRRLAGTLGLEERVRFVGAQDNVMNLLSTIDILVLPSVAHEDFPNVVLEAMGFGKPVIASELAGTPEQVENGVTGLLVPPGDALSLASAMFRLADNPVLRDRMGKAGRSRFEANFTAEASVDRYAALYHSLTKNGRS